MKKDLRTIFISLFFYGLASGAFYNFIELWMQVNNLSIKTISTVLSLGSLLTISVIFLCVNLVKESKTKSFCTSLLLIRTILLILLFFLNGTGLNILIKFLIMVDYVIMVEIFACMYPIMAMVKQDDKVFARKEIIYSASYYIGVFLTTFLLGKKLLITINYNTYCILSALSMLISYIVLKRLNLKKYERIIKDEDQTQNLSEVFNIVKKDKISKIYLVFVSIQGISYYAVTGIFITLLMKIGYTETVSANIKLVLGVLSVILAFIVLSKLTSKNDYINLFFKFVMRVILFIVALIIDNKIFYLIAIFYVRLSSDSYCDITDAPYVNRFKKEHQLSFNSIKEMVSYFSDAIGLYLSGILVLKGVKYVIICALIFTFIQSAFAYVALYYRNKEKTL